MVLALAKEIEMRKSEILDFARNDMEIETIYFGGGTPSILQIADLRFLIDEAGKVVALEGEDADMKATIFFPSAGQKQLLLKFAKLKLA